MSCDQTPFPEPELGSLGSADNSFPSTATHLSPMLSVEESGSGKECEAGPAAAGGQEDTHTPKTRSKQSCSRRNDGVNSNRVPLNPSLFYFPTFHYLASELASRLRSLPLGTDTIMELVTNDRLPKLLQSYSKRLQTPPEAALDYAGFVSYHAE